MKQDVDRGDSVDGSTGLRGAGKAPDVQAHRDLHVGVLRHRHEALGMEIEDLPKRGRGRKSLDELKQLADPLDNEGPAPFDARASLLS